MSRSRAFRNGPNAENESAQSKPRRKVKAYRNSMMGEMTAGWVPAQSRVNTHDRLTGRDRSTLPLTALQAEALAALSDNPAGPKALSERCSLSAAQLHSALWGLSAKGLAVRTGKGWVRA